LFDLGNVVIEIDFNRAFSRWADFATRRPEEIAARFSFDDAYAEHERGRIHAAQYFAHLRDRLGINIADARFLEGWNDIFVGEVPGIAALLAAARRQVPLYAFTNSNVAHERHWSLRYESVLSHFRKVYVSSTIGLRKPDAAAFDYVAADIGILPERILFFDDLPANVAGAAARGLKAVHVTSFFDVERACGPWLHG
jgi:putative hydrolase of the HAD superfamily